MQLNATKCLKELHDKKESKILNSPWTSISLPHVTICNIVYPSKGKEPPHGAASRYTVCYGNPLRRFYAPVSSNGFDPERLHAPKLQLLATTDAAGVESILLLQLVVTLKKQLQNIAFPGKDISKYWRKVAFVMRTLGWKKDAEAILSCLIGFKIFFV